MQRKRNEKEHLWSDVLYTYLVPLHLHSGTKVPPTLKEGAAARVLL